MSGRKSTSSGVCWGLEVTKKANNSEERGSQRNGNELMCQEVRNEGGLKAGSQNGG